MFFSLTAYGQERVGEASFNKFLQGIIGTLYTNRISVTPSHNLMPLICYGVFLGFFVGCCPFVLKKRIKGFFMHNCICEVFLSHCFSGDQTVLSDSVKCIRRSQALLLSQIISYNFCILLKSVPSLQ